MLCKSLPRGFRGCKTQRTIDNMDMVVILLCECERSVSGIGEVAVCQNLTAIYKIRIRRMFAVLKENESRDAMATSWPTFPQTWGRFSLHFVLYCRHLTLVRLILRNEKLGFWAQVGTSNFVCTAATVLGLWIGKMGSILKLSPWQCGVYMSVGECGDLYRCAVGYFPCPYIPSRRTIRRLS